MTTLVFSTLDHHGLNYEPRVTIDLTHSDQAQVVYSPSIPAPNRDEKLEYTLDFELALPTLQRFLSHLWYMTKSEPLPTDMRSPVYPFDAPILESPRRSTNRAEQGAAGQPATDDESE